MAMAPTISVACDGDAGLAQRGQQEIQSQEQRYHGHDNQGEHPVNEESLSSGSLFFGREIIL